jgi:hypothetical protein
MQHYDLTWNEIDYLHTKKLIITHDPRFIIIVRLLLEKDRFTVILDCQSTDFCDEDGNKTKYMTVSTLQPLCISTKHADV